MSVNRLIISSISVLFFLIPVTVLSQTEYKASGTEQDSTAGKAASMHSLFSSIGYGSNMIYLGSTISQDQPYGYGALTYGLDDKLYITVSAVHLAERSPFAAFYIGTASYNHVFNSWFDISAGISRYQVASSLTDTLFNSFFYSDITLGIDWKILYTKISAGGLLMNGARAYFQIRNSRFFQTPGFTSKDYYFSFDPYFNILTGSMTQEETITGTTVTLTPPFRKKGTSGSQSSSSTIYTTIFGIMEADFGVPIAFNTGRMTIEAEPSYILPVYDDTEYPGLKGFNFMVSVYFRIF